MDKGGSTLIFIPMEEAGERMGLSREWVNFLVSTGRLRSAASVSDPQTTLIDVKSIDRDQILQLVESGLETSVGRA